MKTFPSWLFLLLASVWLIVRLLLLVRRDERRERRRQERCRAIEPNETVKEFVHPKGTERIRIFRCPNASFGVVFEILEAGAWRPKQVLGPGAVYDSAEAAARETTALQRWLQAKEWPKLV